MKIRLVVADDHRIFLDGLISLLEVDETIEIVGIARNGQEAIEKVLELSPDILIIDIGMPKMDGIEATRRLKKEIPGLKIIALSMYAHKQYVIRMLKAGIDAYLLKNSSSQELLHVVRTVYDNKNYLSEEITGLVMKDYAKFVKANEK